MYYGDIILTCIIAPANQVEQANGTRPHFAYEFVFFREEIKNPKSYLSQWQENETTQPNKNNFYYCLYKQKIFINKNSRILFLRKEIIFLECFIFWYWFLFSRNIYKLCLGYLMVVVKIKSNSKFQRKFVVS